MRINNPDIFPVKTFIQQAHSLTAGNKSIDGFGEYGEGYVRIALVENEQRIRQAARNVRRFLETAPEQLHNVVPLATRR